MNWDIRLNEEVDLLRESVKDFADKEITPIDVDIDQKMNVFFIDGSNRIYCWNQFWSLKGIDKYASGATFLTEAGEDTFVFSQTDCVDGRYVESLFDVEVTYGVQYGGNTSETILGSEFWQDLYMDIYEPAGDELLNRPLIIFMFGGAFVTGAKSSSCLLYTSDAADE